MNQNRQRASCPLEIAAGAAMNVSNSANWQKPQFDIQAAQKRRPHLFGGLEAEEAAKERWLDADEASRVDKSSHTTDEDFMPLVNGLW